MSATTAHRICRAGIAHLPQQLVVLCALAIAVATRRRCMADEFSCRFGPPASVGR